MPVKRRLSKANPHRITPDAVLAFYDHNMIGLHRALGLKPWMPSPLDVFQVEPPAWASGPCAAFWPVAWGLRLDLEGKGRAIDPPEFQFRAKI
jgi:hypothetical protein